MELTALPHHFCDMMIARLDPKKGQTCSHKQTPLFCGVLSMFFNEELVHTSHFP